MRILHLCPSLAAGGAERQLCYLSRELGNRGHDVHIVLQNTGPNIHFLAGVKNVHLYVLGKGKRVADGERSVANYNPVPVARVFQMLRRLRPDVVQTWIPQMDIVGGIAAKVTGVPWILREPSSGLAYVKGGIKVTVRAWLGRAASIVVANSRAGSDYWGSIEPSIRRVVIRNGVPLAELERTACLEHPGIPAGVPLILWAGRFDQQKNVERTFQAMIDAVFRSSAKAIICGSGPLRSRLEQMVSSVSDPCRVELWPYQAQLWPLMKRAQVFVSASYNEGSPNGVLEAMACRCPLVVSDIPEHREFLSPESAEFVDPRSLSSITNGIERVLTNSTLVEARVQKAYSDIAQFSVEKMVSHYEDLYRSVSTSVH
jgi:glycosyltransferase involved in cell wall biosynthesis